MSLTVDAMCPVCAWCDVLENFAGWTLPTENRAGPISPARRTAGSATDPVSAWPNDAPCIFIIVALDSHNTHTNRQNANTIIYRLLHSFSLWSPQVLKENRW